MGILQHPTENCPPPISASGLCPPPPLLYPPGPTHATQLVNITATPHPPSHGPSLPLRIHTTLSSSPQTPPPHPPPFPTPPPASPPSTSAPLPTTTSQTRRSYQHHQTQKVDPPLTLPSLLINHLATCSTSSDNPL